jgi:hypothetical protein
MIKGDRSLATSALAASILNENMVAFLFSSLCFTRNDEVVVA